MAVPVFTPAPLEWRLLARACQACAARERERAAACPDRRNARDFIISAEGYEQLAAKCMEMARG